jgi:hypothetical protein
MQFKRDTHVYSADHRDIGCIERVVINPITKAVTHIVIPQGMLSEDKVILVDYFEQTTNDSARLRWDIDELDELPKFNDIEFVSIDPREMETFLNEVENGPFYLYWNPAAEGGSPLSYNWLLWYRQQAQ